MGAGYFAAGRTALIRQAISCDICGAEKRQTNHWFVAYIQGDELRVSGWRSNQRLRVGTKHLCGQTCLHKLVDDFMAGKLTVRLQNSSHDPEAVEAESEIAGIDTSLTFAATYETEEPLPGPIGVPEAAQPLPARLVQAPEADPVSLPGTADASLTQVAPRREDPVAYASRRWRADAWKREQDRELRDSGIHSRRTIF